QTASRSAPRWTPRRARRVVRASVAPAEAAANQANPPSHSLLRRGPRSSQSRGAAPAVAARLVRIEPPGRLHERFDDGRPDEAHPSPVKILRKDGRVREPAQIRIE